MMDHLFHIKWVPIEFGSLSPIKRIQVDKKMKSEVFQWAKICLNDDNVKKQGVSEKKCKLINNKKLCTLKFYQTEFSIIY